MNSKYFPFLLIFSVVSAAIEIELSLPSFPDIARAFSVSEQVVEGTISVNFLGFCLSAIFYGPLSDHFGRRPILLMGSALFLIGSISCALASTIEIILLSRFIQGLGAAGSFVIVFTMISDTYKGKEATQWIGRLNAILTATIAFAPVLGGYLNAYFGWSSCYTAVAIITSIQLISLICYLPETRQGQHIKISNVISNYRELLASIRFLQGSLIPSLIAGGWMAFISVIPFLYRDELGMSLREFSWHQTLLIASFSITSYYANAISGYFGEARSVIVGSLLSLLATSILLIMSIMADIPPVMLITALMCLSSAASAIPCAVVFSISLSIVPGNNGAASSLLMAIRNMICALSVQWAGYLYKGALFSSATLLALSYLISFLLTIGFYRTRGEFKQSSGEEFLVH